MATIQNRTYSSSNWVFDLDGGMVGYINKVSGGSWTNELYEHKMGGSSFMSKSTGPIDVTPFAFSAGAGMSKAFWTWIKQSMDLNCMYKDAGCVFADFNFKAQRRMDMLGCLVTEMKLPKWDGASKNNAYIDFKMLPEMVRYAKAGGEDVRATLGPASKRWHESNFNCTIPGLPCERVSTIEGAGYTVKTIKDSIGKGREYQNVPANFNCSDVTITFSKADAGAYEDYANEWFRLGNNTQSHEKDITIEILGANQSDVLGTINLLGCGPKKAHFHEEANQAHAETVARSKFEWFVERMEVFIDEADA